MLTTKSMKGRRKKETAMLGLSYIQKLI